MLRLMVDAKYLKHCSIQGTQSCNLSVLLMGK